MPAKAGIQYSQKVRLGTNDSRKPFRRLLGRPVKPGDDTEWGAALSGISQAALFG
jgi:hypothetical protein